MLSTQLIIIVSALYLALMFFIAYRADKRESAFSVRFQPLIYTLSLAVYCTSWTFYGAVGTAATDGLSFFTIYLGPILVFTLFFSFLQRVIEIAKRNKITSIADFLGTRYGKCNTLAALVTIIAFIGTMPYIALQIKAISSSFDMLTVGAQYGGETLAGNTALWLTIVLAVFSIFFGARSIDASEHHPGLLAAISFESVVKLLAFLAIAIIAFGVLDRLSLQSPEVFSTTSLLWLPFADTDWQPKLLTTLLLSAGAIFLLPRQFHVLAVQASGHEKQSRWGLPLYLLIFSVAVIPITSAGLMVIGEKQNADLYVLLVPMSEESPVLSLLAFIGGFSAATGMVIVATLALSTMVSNELIFPALVRFYRGNVRRQDYRSLLFVRRMTIVAVLIMGWLYYDAGGTERSLQSIGLLSFALAIQFLPAFIGAVYWYRGHRYGALAGLLAGLSVWVYCLFIPSLAALEWMPGGLVEFLQSDSLLNPQALLGWPMSDPLTHGVVWSLLLNTILYVLVSLRVRPTLIDRLQAATYLEMTLPGGREDAFQPFRIIDLVELCNRFTGEERTRQYFQEQGFDVSRDGAQQVSEHFMLLSERLLASSIGTATAERLLNSLRQTDSRPQQELIGLLERTGQAIEFNRELLQVTLDHIGEAVSVVDKDLRLVAWNQQYLKFFDYQPQMLRVGRPISELIRMNIKRGFGPGYEDDVEAVIARRLEMLRNVNKYSFVRDWQNGKTVQTVGARLPGGGYVTTYTDITALKKAEKRLEAINETLEAKVEERTLMLKQVNDQLASVINTKTHFLAAASHDLLQPLGASKLYLGALQEDLRQQPDKQQLAQGAFDALTTAESLLKSLLYLSKMDSGLLKPEITDFALQDIFNLLDNEFNLSAAQKGLTLRIVPTVFTTATDKSLLLSICQNLLANALRYTSSGKIMVSCRRQGAKLRIDVRDSGHGIAEDRQEEIFQAFTRLRHDDSEGVGLGLAICRKASDLLDLQLSVRSSPGRGSIFSVTIPCGERQVDKVNDLAKVFDETLFKGLQVLCVDDNQSMLEATRQLLLRWDMQVMTATNADEFLQLVGERFFDVIIMDYQLHDRINGLELLDQYRLDCGEMFLGIIATAEQNADVLRHIRESGFVYMPKPLDGQALHSEIGIYLS